MASSLALKRLVSSSSIVPRSRYLLRPEVTSRLLNTNAVQSYDDGVDVDRCSDFFPDVFDPFSPTTSVSQVLNLMDQFMENPLLSSVTRGWDIKEKEDALYLRMD
ncbi:hypothetical protein AALP_AA2G064000 [Arabis alpina]|uniref:Uncharacterized protein n=1 Tax=Arabis alpina TaxID=50452 RepID=A0A087HFN9_ARAAL|nr:hypothetical protein AALP_AA2G064000 [Arabis alpina]